MNCYLDVYLEVKWCMHNCAYFATVRPKVLLCERLQLEQGLTRAMADKQDDRLDLYQYTETGYDY